ncbi:hypothetical protein [Jiulongibacter sp. NS-SX5]|uniref:hypothetical protein n=1 Tax=Jiulongibacter sp. NS-SX5 TaxID=3463854 RepID=UPI004057E898
MTTKRSNWITALIILATFILIFLPVQVASPKIQRMIVTAVGAGSILLQLLLIRSSKEKAQSFLVLGLTIAAIALMFVAYA